MRYVNATGVLPEELISQIQKYVQGEYIYIPVAHRYAAAPATVYKTELEKRNAHIYTKHLEGTANQRLAELYHLSESSIRRIIMKQRMEDAGMKERIRKILSRWELQDSEVRQIYDTAWQAGDSFVLKRYQDREMLERNIKILKMLDERGIPVGQVIPAKDQAPYVYDEGSCYFLSRKLEGSNLIQIDNIRETAGIMGEVMAELHLAFQSCETVGGFWDNSLLDEMNGWVREAFEKTGWNYIGRKDYEKIVSHLAESYDQLPVQLIHRDVHFGNFIFLGGRFSGYIDFDLSQRNIRIFDLCYFLLSLLSEEEKLVLSEEQWFEFLKHTFSGYEKISPLSEREKQAAPCVMECIELLFAAWFDQAEDFQCARDAHRIFNFVKGREERICRVIA